MITNSNYICPTCSKTYPTYKGLQGHFSRNHKDLGLDYLRTQIFYNGIRPKCECGCGEFTEWQVGKGGKYAKYIKYHGIKTRGFWGTKEGLDKSAETRRKKFASGELVQYNKGKSWKELYNDETINRLLLNYKSSDRNSKISNNLKETLAKRAGYISREDYELQLPDKIKYYRKVGKLTRKNIHLLPEYDSSKHGLCGVDGAYQIDHIIPISYGYDNNIPPEIIADVSNLQFIPWEENLSKSDKILK